MDPVNNVGHETMRYRSSYWIQQQSLLKLHTSPSGDSLEVDLVVADAARARLCETSAVDREARADEGSVLRATEVGSPAKCELEASATTVAEPSIWARFAFSNDLI